MQVIGHQLPSDLSAAVRNGQAIPQGVEYIDTEVGCRWLWPDLPDHGLEQIALRHSDMAHWRPNLEKLEGADFDAMPDGDLGARCAGDAEATERLATFVLDGITKAGMRTVWDLAMHVLPILAQMGGEGMALNAKALRFRRRKLGGSGSDPGWLAREKGELEAILKIDNLDSNPQLSKMLFDPAGLGAEPLEETETGYSVNKVSKLWARRQAVAKGNVQLGDLITRLMAYQSQEKLYKTYYSPWYEQSIKAPKLFSVYALGRTATGRLSSYQFNLQNLPPVTRELVVPSPGYDWIVQADYKQLELVTASFVSRDRVMREAIRADKDLHAITAARVLGLPEPKTKDEFTAFKAQYPLQRATGKLANFSTLFGIEPESFTWKVFADTDGEIYIPPDESKAYIDAFFSLFAGYKTHTEVLRQAIHRGEWIVSPTGRRWLLPPNDAGWRKAMNYPIQSLASDLVLLALGTLSATLRQDRWHARLMGEVHDSLVLECTDRELHPLLHLLQQVCEQPDTSRFGFRLTVPLRVELQAGRSWGSLEPITPI